MTIKRLHCSMAAALIVAMAGLASSSVSAQTKIKPGFNLFSTEQDLAIGSRSAAEADRQLPILRDRKVEAYVAAVGKRLSANLPGAKFPYQFKIVNASDINAFALPGGYMYLNRGLIEAAKSEGQLAGVMAHEMSHVALRHGTNQASKAYLGQTGFGILGGLLSKDDGSPNKLIDAVGGFGLNALFLKFSRTDEGQADIVGAQTMARAGYDPQDMVNFFELLRSTQSHDPSKVEQFFSSHPAPENRAARIQNEMALLTIRPTAPVGGFKEARATLLAMPAARSTQQLAQNQPATPQPRTYPDSQVGDISIEAPSSTYRTFEQRDRFFGIEYPSNWRVHASADGPGVTIAPDGGVVDTGRTEKDLIYGVVINHYVPFLNDEDDTDGRFSFLGAPGDLSDQNVSRTSLAEATNDLVGQILRTNPTLKLVPDSQRNDKIDGAAALSLVLSGRSAATGAEERVTVFTRELPDDHVIYALFIAPGQDYGQLKATFNRMIGSLRVSDEPTHRSSVGRGFVPSGTVLAVEFQQTLSSANSQAGDLFTARVLEPVLVDGRVAIATGSIVSGRVVNALPAKKIGGKAQLNLEFTSLRIASGDNSPISASFRGQAKSQTTKDAATIGGAAAGGAVVGRAIGKDTRGTVLGAVVGGAIGTGIAASNKGQEVTLPEGMSIEIQLDSPFRV
jgi:beta-barrel assembly-enhancing protease